MVHSHFQPNSIDSLFMQLQIEEVSQPLYGQSRPHHVQHCSRCQLWPRQQRAPWGLRQRREVLLDPNARYQRSHCLSLDSCRNPR
jgi:hypothetical protein